MKLAILVPCYNEEKTVAKVVTDARAAFPAADVYVFDNNSQDATAVRAREAGAIVIPSPLQGKGNVVRHAFETVDADVYLMLDGDDTYPLEGAPGLIAAISERGFDMAVGTRLTDFSPGAFRRFHLFGNHFLSVTVTRLFGQRITDMLSGYRAFSRAFVEQVPLNSRGFEIETDLTLQAISKGFAVCEIAVPYRNRPEGSHSKLKTYEDGFLILSFLFRLFKDYRPLPFFGVGAALCFLMALVSGWGPIADYLTYAYVYTVPRAVLAASLMVLSGILLGVGLILDSQIRYFNEQFVMMKKINRRRARADQNSGLRRAG